MKAKLNRKIFFNESIQTLRNILLSLRTETLEHFLFQNLSDLMIFRERYRERVERQGQEQRINIIRGRTGRNIKFFNWSHSAQSQLPWALAVVLIDYCSNWR